MLKNGILVAVYNYKIYGIRVDHILAAHQQVINASKAHFIAFIRAIVYMRKEPLPVATAAQRK